MIVPLRYVEKPAIERQAKRNWRGITTNEIVYEILDTQYKLDMLDISPEDVIGFQRPLGCSEDEWIEDHRCYLNAVLIDAQRELERRRNINGALVTSPDREIIQVIKEAVPIADVLEWYTEVFYSSRDQWKFRCTLHGKDNNPSGVIFVKERRWWCFGCNKGGDVLDVVCAFERVELPKAIKKLATYAGIELRPLIQKPIPQVRGGAVL